jgi:hypothetical protein
LYGSRFLLLSRTIVFVILQRKGFTYSVVRAKLQMKYRHHERQLYRVDSERKSGAAVAQTGELELRQMVAFVLF